MNTNKLRQDLAKVLNSHSIDAQLGIPDYLLAKYLTNQLDQLWELSTEMKNSTDDETYVTQPDTFAPIVKGLMR
jgi:hypothetical protein